MENVTLANGQEIRFDVALNYMDAEICEQLNDEIAPCSDQAFTDAYCARHFEKFGEEFEIN